MIEEISEESRNSNIPPMKEIKIEEEYSENKYKEAMKLKDIEESSLNIIIKK